MNHHIHDQLSKHFKINLLENINPPYSFISRGASKCLRMLSFRGVFTAFSVQRLNRIKSIVQSRLNNAATLNFYHGATPWLHIKNELPYALYLDASFATYIEVYHKQSSFSKHQLQQLFLKESDFLKNATAVFFSSAWALNQTKKKYQLTGDNFFTAGLGGSLKKQTKPCSSTEPYFLFVSLDFLGKGGDKVVAAFAALLKDFPQYELKIVGECPPAHVLKNAHVTYIGKLNKSNPVDAEKLMTLFAEAFCFVLPTTKDMTPLVLVEAGSVGCPVISVNNFGIPEIVKQNETGMLLNASENIETALHEAMVSLCSNTSKRNQLGAWAYEYVNKNFCWDKTGELIVSTINASVN